MSFLCHGRGYPNAPPQAKVQCFNRPPPMIWQWMVEHWSIVHPGLPSTFTWHNALFSGISPLPPVVNPRVNWNHHPSVPSFTANVHTVWNKGFELRVQFIWSVFGSSRRSRFIWKGGQNGVGWHEAFEASPTLDPDPAFFPIVADDFVHLRMGLYSRIPANSCDGA